MDFWQRAKSFAEEAAKRSQEITKEIGSSSRLSEVVSEASKRSKEIAAEAAKRSQQFTKEIGSSSRLSEVVSEASKRSLEISNQIKLQALKRADFIKSQLPATALSSSSSSPLSQKADLEMYGVTDDLREFVKGITTNTFQDFPLHDDSEMSDILTVSNVRQDLTEWQEKHAKLVLSTVKEISKLRYELCPRVMKERKFWRIYFILVNSHVAPYEQRYMEEAPIKTVQNVQDDTVKEMSGVGATSKLAAEGTDQKVKRATSSASDQDLDVFLLGDMEDDDAGPDDGDDSFDDDFDKI